MKILDKKKILCTSIKVLYTTDYERAIDTKSKRSEGWKQNSKSKQTNDGIVVNFIKHEKLES
jgi:hypothetical protein